MLNPMKSLSPVNTIDLSLVFCDGGFKAIRDLFVFFYKYRLILNTVQTGNVLFVKTQYTRTRPERQMPRSAALSQKAVMVCLPSSFVIV